MAGQKTSTSRIISFGKIVEIVRENAFSRLIVGNNGRQKFRAIFRLRERKTALLYAEKRPPARDVRFFSFSPDEKNFKMFLHRCELFFVCFGLTFFCRCFSFLRCFASPKEGVFAVFVSSPDSFTTRVRKSFLVCVIECNNFVVVFPRYRF